MSHYKIIVIHRVMKFASQIAPLLYKDFLHKMNLGGRVQQRMWQSNTFCIDSSLACRQQ